jgi:bifunctional DNA-binding transcriptional regulator/antitoxin component of YhaV-PrlF toxin-antitoxin module
MTKTIIQIKDNKQRRIVIPQEVWDLEELQKDDYVEIDVKKVKKPK